MTLSLPAGWTVTVVDGESGEREVPDPVLTNSVAQRQVESSFELAYRTERRKWWRATEWFTRMWWWEQLRAAAARDGDDVDDGE